jgi:tetratricopeptide (TPR) repeat protein
MSEQERFSTGSAIALTPFWRRLPRFFLYPMQIGSMLRIAGYSIIGGGSMFIPSLFGIALSFILWIVFLKYAFLVMERTANGRFDEPDGMQGDAGDTVQVLKQFALFAIVALLAVILTDLFGGIGTLLVFLLGVMIPAGIMILATTKSLNEAVHPGRIFFYIKTIGSPYLALCFLLISLTGSGQWLKGFLAGHMNSFLVLPLLHFVEFYFTLIMYHMMGYVIYQYHGALGLQAAVSYEKAEARQMPGKDPILAKLGALIANGQQQEAIDLLREELRQRWENNDLHDRYQKLLMASGKQTTALLHAREFIAKLANEKRMFQALDLCEQSLKLDPEFTLQDSYQVYELANAAYMAKRQKLALDLMRRFDKRYPGHPHTPSIYLLSARILGDHFRMTQEATQILRALQSKFPDHTAAEEARQYLNTLNRLAAAG